MKLHLVPFSRIAGRRHRRTAAAVVSAQADDVLLWHLDEDGWD